MHNSRFFSATTVTLYGGEASGTGSTVTEDTKWPIVPAPDDAECEATGGILGKGNRSTGRKPAPVAALSTTNPT
jgi:hypothetical protein